MDVGHCYLDGNADVVEFCPHDSFHHVLAASTYNLQEGDQPSRSGSISLFKVNLGQVDLFYRLKTSGIFDMKWNPVGDNTIRPLLAQADADGCLMIHHLQNSVNDYIGKIDNVTNTFRQKNRTLLKIKLQDPTGSFIEATLWEEIAISFDKEVVSHLTPQIIDALTSMKVTEYQGILQLGSTALGSNLHLFESRYR